MKPKPSKVKIVAKQTGEHVDKPFWCLHPNGFYRLMSKIYTYKKGKWYEYED